MIWDTIAMNWVQGNNAYAYKDGVEVVFRDTCSGSVTLKGTFSPKSVNVQNSSGHNYIWIGSGRLAGAMQLTKDGTGSLTINVANTYAGGTTISGGTLRVGNKSALGTGMVKLAGGTLEVGASGFANNIKVSGNSTLSVLADITLALKNVISNSGLFAMSGNFDVSALPLTQGGAGYLDTNGNMGTSGFSVRDIYSVTLVSGGSTVNGGATVTHGSLPGGLTLTLGTDGKATAGGTVDYSTYLLTGSDTAATSAIHAKGAGATVTQTGGTLTVDDAATVNSTGGAVKLTQAVTLGGSISNAAVTASAGTISAAMSGSTSLTTSGNVTLSGAKTYTGMTTVNSGTLTLGGGLKSDVTINGGTLNTGSGLTLSSGQDILLKSGSISGNLTTSAGSSLTISPSSASVNGALTLGGGTLNLDDNILNVSGALTLNSKTTLSVSSSYGFGEHTLISAGSISGNTDNITICGASGAYEILKEGNKLVLSITRAPRDINFPAGGTWANNDEPFVNGDRVTFTDCGTITVNGTVKPGAMIVTGEGDTTWGGSGSVAGNSALIKDGSGTLTINTSNSFSGGTEIRQGTVSAGADNALGTGAVTMQAGTTLKLIGRNLGQNDVTVSAAAMLAAGSGGQVRSLTLSTAGGAQGQQGELLFAERLELSGTLKTGTLTLEKGNIEGGSITVTGAATVEQGYLGSNISGNTLEKTGDKRVELKGTNSFSGGATVSGGQLALLEGGSFSGNVSVKTGAALLAGVTVNGDITLASGADMHLRPGTTYRLQHQLTSSGGTLHGDCTTAGGAAITLNTSSTTTAGLTVSGTLTLTSSLTQGSLSAGGSWSTGNTYTLIQADHLNDQSGKSLYRLFNLSESGYTITNTGSAVTLKKKTAVSTALQRMAATAPPAMAADDEGGIIITGAPEPLLTKTAVDGVADAMVQADWGVVDAERAFGNTMRDAHGNLRALGNGNSAVWVNAFGNMTRQSTAHGHAGADRDLTGAALGFETMAGEHGVAGIGIGHSWGHVNTFAMSRLKQDAQHAGVFGRARVHATDKNSLWLEGSAAYGKTESRGQLGYSRERWTQNSGSLTMRVNDVLQLDGGTSLNFYGGLEYLATDNGRIDDLRTGSVQDLRGEIGAGIQHRAGDAVVYAEAALQGDMVRHNPQADVGIRRHGANPGRIGGSITVGGAYSLGEHWSVNAAYTFEGVKHSNSHNANVGATIRF